MRHIRSAVACAITLALAMSVLQVPAEAESLNDVLARGSKHGFPAMTVLVDRPGAAPLMGATGYSSLEDQTPARVTDSYPMASITKVVTAVAVMQLVDAGKITLDEHIMKILGKKIVGPIPYGDEITVGQLLSHASGIYSFNNNRVYLDSLLGSGAFKPFQWTPKKFVALSYDRKKYPPLGKPGEGHFYSDTNYVLLGMIVAKVTGRPFKDVVRSAIFEPLGMTSTYFFSSYYQKGEVPPGHRAQGYTVISDELRAAVDINPRFPHAGPDLINTTGADEQTDAAAGLITTVIDLDRFARALFRGDLLRPASLAWLENVADGIQSEPVGTSREWALEADREPYGVILSKSGDGPGVNTVLAFEPKSQTIVIVFTNLFGRWDENEFIFSDILPAVLKLP